MALEALPVFNQSVGNLRVDLGPPYSAAHLLSVIFAGHQALRGLPYYPRVMYKKMQEDTFFTEKSAKQHAQILLIIL